MVCHVLSITFAYRFGSTLDQVMVCCLMAPSHYLDQCWLVIGEVLWEFHNGCPQPLFGIINLNIMNITATYPRDHLVECDISAWIIAFDWIKFVAQNIPYDGDCCLTRENGIIRTENSFVEFAMGSRTPPIHTPLTTSLITLYNIPSIPRGIFYQ